MESPTRSAPSLRSESHHRPAHSSPLRSVFASGTPGTKRIGGGKESMGRRSTVRGGIDGMPFALTIPPSSTSLISGARNGISGGTTPRQGRARDENTPVEGLVHTTTLGKDTPSTITKMKKRAVPVGDQTMFAPVLLAVGDQSLLMEQQLPSYKDLWNDSEEEGDADGFASFKDSMEEGLRDGSVRIRAGGLGRSILGASTAGNQTSDDAEPAVGKSKARLTESRLAKLYKPTPKPDTSSRRRSALFARQSIYGEKGFEFSEKGGADVLVPLEGPSSPSFGMAQDSRYDGDFLVDETMTAIRGDQFGDDTEEEEAGMDVAVADEQVGATEGRNGSQVLASQGSLVSASQSIPELTQSQPDVRPSPSTQTVRRRSPDIPSAGATTPRSPAHHAAASKKRTASQRPEASATPSRRGAALTASARNSPNPRARKAARKSTKGGKNTRVEDIPPSSPNVPLATEMRQSLSAAQTKQPSKSRRRSSTAPLETTKRRPRASKAQAPVSASQPVVSKTRRLSGRKSTGSLPSTQNTLSTVKRTRHSLSAPTAKSASPGGKRKPRQSLAPLELVERVGLLDIPQRPASPTEDPLLLVPSARRSVGSGSRRTTVGEGRDTVREGKGGPPNGDHRSERASSSPLANIQETQAQSETVNAYENDESHDLPAVLSTPSSSRNERQRAGSHALGSSPWVAADLSIFSPTAMASSPVRPSPVRWRIASPLPETQQTAGVSMGEDIETGVPGVSHAEMAEEHPVSRESTPRAGEEAEEEADMQSSPTQHGSEREVPQFEDAAVDYMQETDWRAYEREDSPMSSHGGEVGGEEVADEVDDGLREEGRPDSPEAAPEEVADALGPQPNTEHEPEASGEIDILPEQQPASAMESQASAMQPTQDSTENDQPLVLTKKKVGRICLRLPLHPTIVKVESVDEAYSVASKETETSTTMETEDGSLPVAQEPEVPLEEEHSPTVGGKAISDQEAELAVSEEEHASLSLTGDVVREESLGGENSQTETRDLAVQVEAEAVNVGAERPEPVVETSTTVVSEEPAAVTETPALAQSSKTVLHADSPFQQRPTQETVSPVPQAAQDGTSSKRLFRESVSSISVTSEDPRAAARAAALLKLHHRYLNEGPGVEILSSIPLPTPENVKASPRRRRISQYFQSAETASALTLPELLQEAELELVDNTVFGIRATLSSITSGPAPVYSPFPMPGSWSSINPVMSGLTKGRINFGQWTIEDWQDLERCYKRIYKKKAKSDSQGKHMWNADDSTEVVHSLCKLKRIAIYELRDEWARETLLLRINTLHRKRKSATADTTDSPVVATTTARSPKRLKANDLNAVEIPVPAVPASSSQRLKGLLSRGWRSVLQILEPSKSVDLTQVAGVASTTARTERETGHRPTTASAAKSHLMASEREIITETPVQLAKVATPVAPVNQHQSVMQEMTARRASVLARAKELENVLQRGTTESSARPQLNRSTSTTSSLVRRFATPDASSSRSISSLPRRSLGSPQASPSVKNMIQSFERSFEKDESANANKTDSPVSHELRRLSSRRSVSGKSSLREVLEAGMGGTTHHAT